MTSLPFSSLSSSQQALAAATFRDDIFGASSEDYLYEVAADTGLLTGQRSLVNLEDRKKKPAYGKSTQTIMASGPTGNIERSKP